MTWGNSSVCCQACGKAKVASSLAVGQVSPGCLSFFFLSFLFSFYFPVGRILWLHSNRVNALLVNQDMCPATRRKPREGERRNERKKGKTSHFINLEPELYRRAACHPEFTLWYVVICRRCDRFFASADILLIPSAGPTSSYIKREGKKCVTLLSKSESTAATLFQTSTRRVPFVP